MAFPKKQQTDFVDMSANDMANDPSVTGETTDPSVSSPSVSSPSIKGMVRAASPALKGAKLARTKSTLPSFLKMKKPKTTKGKTGKMPKKLSVPGLSAIKGKVKQYASLIPSAPKQSTRPIGSGIKALRGM